ncbi:DUF4157 domain-containing protein [Flavobacterium jejuense]|uniref:DUF4157 domain-containing protein n=1 Tax=Flavobacterium jejuense TaxID=1544455 RepID=A0ABX0IJS2_9FLAO|nr:DUF4157 domain-containing protein [Flavobacterium jejuense]NHN24080.1 DUF4157 domain-containing protein [Flavobacterium jejuense]
MKTQNDITQEKETTPVQRIQQEASDGGTAQLVDNRESTTIQRKLQDSMSAATENTTNPIQRKNNTGLPDNLKTGIENLSGYSMDDVKVHYNSSKPAQLQAHAYAQGTDIHLASGQEKHLPHEAWHVVQQKQGRVKPTKQLKSKVNINDDTGLEREADVMGDRVASAVFQSFHNKSVSTGGSAKPSSSFIVQRKEQGKKKKSKESQLSNLTSFGPFSRYSKQKKQSIERMLTTLFMNYGVSYKTAKNVKNLLVKLSIDDLRVLEENMNNLIGNDVSIQVIEKVFLPLTGINLFEQEEENDNKETNEHKLSIKAFQELFSLGNILGIILLSNGDAFYNTTSELPRIIDRQNVKELDNISAQLNEVDVNKGARLLEIINDINKNGTERSLLDLNIALRSVNSPKENVIQELINNLPNTEEALEAVEKLEDELITKSDDTTIGLTINLHKIFHLKKTEILETLIENEVNKKDANPLLNPLKSIGKENYWKMLIDGNVHKYKDKHFYNRSKGFMASMMKGLYLIVREAGNELSVDFLTLLHDKATSKVTNEGIEGEILEKHIDFENLEKDTDLIIDKPLFLNAKFLQTPGIKNQSNRWGINQGTPEGSKELGELIADLDKQLKKSYFLKDPGGNGNSWHSGKGINVEKSTEKLLQYSIDRYNAEIGNAKTKDEKLEIIIDCCRRLGVIHPFLDANGRTIQILLLNKLLLDNDLAPTAMYMQDFMIGRSKKELIHLIKRGQQYLRDEVSTIDPSGSLTKISLSLSNAWVSMKSFFKNKKKKEMTDVIKHFDRLNNPGGGDCLFHSISQLLQHHRGLTISAFKLRKSVIKFYRQKENNAWNIITEGRRSVRTGENTFDNQKNYFNFMKKEGSWATDSEIGALSELYHINICIVQPGNQYHEVFTGFGKRTFVHADSLLNLQNTICIYHQQNLHFEALVLNNG